MYKTLISTNIGSEYSSAIGYDRSTRYTLACTKQFRTPSISIGLQGLKSEDVSTVENIIMYTLQQVSEDGLDLTRVQSVLHQYELSLRHVLHPLNRMDTNLL
jgi:Zn-dependent M16 (insulinase) family peptidase